MSSQDKFFLDISSLKHPIRRSSRLNKNVIIFELSSLVILYTDVYLVLLTFTVDPLYSHTLRDQKKWYDYKNTI